MTSFGVQPQRAPFGSVLSQQPQSCSFHAPWYLPFSPSNLVSFPSSLAGPLFSHCHSARPALVCCCHPTGHLLAAQGFGCLREALPWMPFHHLSLVFNCVPPLASLLCLGVSPHHPDPSSIPRVSRNRASCLLPSSFPHFGQCLLILFNHLLIPLF